MRVDGSINAAGAALNLEAYPVKQKPLLRTSQHTDHCGPGFTTLQGDGPLGSP